MHNFVPVAVNLYKIRDAKDEAGDFFRAARKQKNQYQGFWIVTHDGTVLSGHQEHSEKRWTEEVLATIDAALAKAGPLPRREPEPKDVLPYWGKGVEPDGSVTLALYVRYFFQGKGIGNGAIDAIRLTSKDWHEFAPPEPVANKTWHLPGKIAAEFSRTLSSASDQSFMPRPGEVTEVEIAGTVAQVKDGIATLRYTGRIAALHPHPFAKQYTYTARAVMRGMATYDTTKKEMISLWWIFEGGSREVQAREESPLAAVVEWHRAAGPKH